MATKKIYRISLADARGQLHNVVVTCSAMADAVTAAQKYLGLDASTEAHTCQFVDEIQVEA
jgi:hypothetical protein